MQRFNDFVKLARRWPGNYVIRYEDCRIEWEANILQGIDEEGMIEGITYWLDNCIPMDTSDFKPPAPHTFLRQKSFLAYQPEEKRPRLEVV